jgi:hypothetical protein
MKRSFATLAALLCLLVGLTAVPAAADHEHSRRDPSIHFLTQVKHFRLLGKVNMCGRAKPTSVHYKKRYSQEWRWLRSDRTTRQGRYFYKGLNKVGFYRVYVPKWKGCEAGTSVVLHVTRR